MTPSALLLIGALGATLSSLKSALGSARVALAALPLGVGIVAALEPTALDLWAWSASSGELVSATLKLDVAGEGAQVLSAPLHVAHPLSAWLGYAWCALGAFALLAQWARREQLARLSLTAYAALTALWLLASPVGGFLFTGGLSSGEGALREWLLMSERFDVAQLSSFTLPEGSWRWAPHRLGLLLVAGSAALLGASLPASAGAQQRAFEGSGRLLYQLASLVALAGLMWQLNALGGFVGEAKPWVALICLTVGAVLTHSATQATSLALLALAAVTL